MSDPGENEESGIFGIVKAFKKISSYWNLEFGGILSSAANQCSFSLRSPETVANIRVVSLFDDQWILYVKVDGKCRVINILSADCGEERENGILVTDTRRLSSKLATTIFAPIFQPHIEYKSLGQLSSAPLILICSFLSAIELCQLTQTNKSISIVTNTETLWTDLMAKDFHVESQSRSSAAGSNGLASMDTARSTYRRLRLHRVAERRRKRALEMRRLQELQQQNLWAQQIRADEYNYFGSDLVLPPLRLGLPDPLPAAPFQPPHFRDTHDTWF